MCAILLKHGWLFTHSGSPLRFLEAVGENEQIIPQKNSRYASNPCGIEVIQKQSLIKILLGKFPRRIFINHRLIIIYITRPGRQPRRKAAMQDETSTSVLCYVANQADGEALVSTAVSGSIQPLVCNIQHIGLFWKALASCCTRPVATIADNKINDHF